MSQTPQQTTMSTTELGLAGGLGAALGGLAVYFALRRGGGASKVKFSMADQKKRFATAKKKNLKRVLDIDSVFEPSKLRGKRVLVVGASRGLGLEVAQAAAAAGAEAIGTVRSPNKDVSEAGLAQVIENVDVTSDEGMRTLVDSLKSPVDICIVVAGYFYGPVERLTDKSLNFKEEWKMIDICGIGPLRVANALVNNGRLREKGGRLAIVTSQAGSIEWREVQNPHGDNYGHHMSRACTNMMGRLLSFELKEKGIAVSLLHPGFNRTEMTKKYSEIWDEEGAVEPEVGAKRVLHEVNLMSMNNTGSFVNCEDGLLIPW
ncbi:NADPH-dependent aldehyde reductase-like protein, chloroplastic [Hondaea fermentalgiana]|uniref:NADPH-dependent aldehyde reductase-like protein, chloroplastic n=1 Tax=Hondaea fermentalgiana TaxID=2315210 RepID=A0A2R5GV07_9STRA|nr:NADPH-dependent aldehyde reductase-like protein, chloroplastic [Hondaea fermentalgiana]|eukprot:GBG34680.1 NADPH-dependent aldehyde reductase-like protein, chloroplastic [Hondaea fermentalgiana]